MRGEAIGGKRKVTAAGERERYLARQRYCILLKKRSSLFGKLGRDIA